MPADNHIIQGDVNRVFAFGPLDFIGVALQIFRPVQRLGQVNHIARVFGCFIFGLGFDLFADRQNRTGDLVWPIGRAALATAIPCLKIDLLKIVKSDVLGAVDGFGDARIYPFLRRRLHAHVIERGQRLGVNEIVGQGGVAEPFAPQLNGVILDFFLGARAVLLQNLARIGISEHWFDTTGNIARI